jgi:hypothetical protein
MTECPRCGLVHSNTATLCACGFDLKSGESATGPSSGILQGSTLRVLIAGFTNAGLVLLLLPFARVASSTNLRLLDVLGRDVLIGFPIAALVFWRTVRHSRTFLQDEGWSSRPIVEAAVTGAAIPFLLLLPVLLNPAAPGALWLVVIGAVIGLTMGMLLRTTAVAILRSGRTPAFRDKNR